MRIEAITPKEAARRWGSIGVLLNKAIAFDVERRVTLAGVYEDVQSGHSIALLMFDDNDAVIGACVVTASGERLGRFLYGRLIAGEFENAQWIESVDKFLSDYARACGCTDGIMFIGRRGWANKLKRIGYKEVAVTLIKGVDYERGAFREQ